jgi:hypothetical protein
MVTQNEDLRDVRFAAEVKRLQDLDIEIKHDQAGSTGEAAKAAYRARMNLQSEVSFINGCNDPILVKRLAEAVRHVDPDDPIIRLTGDGKHLEIAPFRMGSDIEPLRIDDDVSLSIDVERALMRVYSPGEDNLFTKIAKYSGARDLANARLYQRHFESYYENKMRYPMTWTTSDLRDMKVLEALLNRQDFQHDPFGPDPGPKVSNLETVARHIGYTDEQGRTFISRQTMGVDIASVAAHALLDEDGALFNQIASLAERKDGRIFREDIAEFLKSNPYYQRYRAPLQIMSDRLTYDPEHGGRDWALALIGREENNFRMFFALPLIRQSLKLYPDLRMH